MAILRLTALALLIGGATACDLLGVDLGTDDADGGDDPTDEQQTDDSGEPDVPTGCLDLCSEADSAGVSEGSCVSLELTRKGYNVIGAPYECAAIAGTETGCLACMEILEVTGEDCADAATTCL